MRIGVNPAHGVWSFEELERSWHAAESSGFEVLACFEPDGVAKAGRGVGCTHAGCDGRANGTDHTCGPRPERVPTSSVLSGSATCSGP